MSGLEPLCALGIFKAGLNTNYWLKKQAFPSWTIKEVKTLLSCWRDEGL
jgi:hypothetical protein